MGLDFTLYYHYFWHLFPSKLVTKIRLSHFINSPTLVHSLQKCSIRLLVSVTVRNQYYPQRSTKKRKFQLLQFHESYSKRYRGALQYDSTPAWYESLEDSYRVRMPQIVASMGRDVTHNGTSHSGYSCYSDSHNDISYPGTSCCLTVQFLSTTREKKPTDHAIMTTLSVATCNGNSHSTLQWHGLKASLVYICEWWQTTLGLSGGWSWASF